MSETVEIEIDGQKLEAAPGSMIIEVADKAGIRIPRFCYHNKLSVAANCRMCLVEVEKVGKPLPACATPVTPGMKVSTQSAKAIDAQKSVMEFLLINHPLDCPICDQGGSCELQDISMGYGPDVSRYTETKRSVKDEDLGSLIATDMTRCIQCTRCVRFGREIAGLRELGAIGRGDRLEIGSYLKNHAMESEISGNIIDLCPVGALTSKPFRFKARAWELNQAESIAPHDGLGSNIYLQTLRHKVMRVVPKDNENINENWLSDRDRFSYEGLYSEDRLAKPLVKINGEWQETDWAVALDMACKRLKNIKEKQGAHQLASLISPNATLEELYLWQKLWRAFGTTHIDHRLHQTDYQDQTEMPLAPVLNLPIEEIENQNIILLIGSHVRHEAPLINHRIRKAVLQGARVVCINPIDFEFNFPIEDNHKKIVSPENMLNILQQIAEQDVFKEILGVENAAKKCILLGAFAFNHPEASVIRAFSQMIAERYGMTLGYLTEGANATGAWLSGCLPHRGPMGETITPAGYGAMTALQEKLPAYILFNIEPDQDFARSVTAMQALRDAECVIAFSAWRAPSLLETADIILPIAPYAETSGTYVNLEGHFQSFQGAVKPYEEARPGWKILRVLGNLLQLQGFEYLSSEAVRDEVKGLMERIPTRAPIKFSKPKMPIAKEIKLQRIADWPIYRGDMLARRAASLQKSLTQAGLAARVNGKTAEKHVLQTKIKNIEIVLDEKIPDDCIYVPAGYAESAILDECFGEVKIC